MLSWTFWEYLFAQESYISRSIIAAIFIDVTSSHLWSLCTPFHWFQNQGLVQPFTSSETERMNLWSLLCSPGNGAIWLEVLPAKIMRAVREDPWAQAATSPRGCPAILGGDPAEGRSCWHWHSCSWFDFYNREAGGMALTYSTRNWLRNWWSAFDRVTPSTSDTVSLVELFWMEHGARPRRKETLSCQETRIWFLGRQFQLTFQKSENLSAKKEIFKVIFRAKI